ncbi:hypothetical protein [Aeromonas hydrophila]|uniref:hypothetical protein n=1 Tax=Aeromonas hydrophila TaxID=644 RepID=UPI0036DE399C
MLAFFRIIYGVLKKTVQIWVGVVLATVTIFGFFYDFKSPDLKIEVTAISNGNDGVIDLIKEPGLSSIKEIISKPSFSLLGMTDMGYDRFVLSQDEISKKILMLKAEIVEEHEEVRRNEDELYKVSKISEPERKYSAIKTLASSNLTIPPLPDEYDTEIKSDSTQLMLLVERDINRGRESLIKKEKQVKQIESDWGVYIENTLPNKARLTVTVAIGNSGSGATSLKPQALFRASIGDGNYLDFPMKLKGYDQGNSDNASFQPRSYKVVRFESEVVGSMTENDRDKFKMFLGNASPARLYVSDVRGNTYSSNSVPFSPGIYEQKAYDLLKQYASSLSSSQ